jgi:spore maturation protein CgeB
VRLIVFGLTVSSSWGNGHATLWRGLWRALADRGHTLVFFERDVPYYAAHRDLDAVPSGELVLYRDWSEVLPRARRELRAADAALVTSFCPDGAAAAALMHAGEGRPLTLFYDLDTPVTLDQLSAGGPMPSLGPRGLRDFDLVLSYTGGPALDALRTRLGARAVATLYGHVDPQVHRPVPPSDAYRCALSYLGTYADDRQPALESLFLAPARRLPAQRFFIGGAQYPADFPWAANIHFVRHLPPTEHPAFFCSSRLTLSVTRRAMADNGHCPSGRLFEAAACGCAVLSDAWAGIEAFFAPGRELLVARGTQDVLDALELSDRELACIAAAARERVLAQHTSAHRALELERLLERARAPQAGTEMDVA